MLHSHQAPPHLRISHSQVYIQDLRWWRNHQALLRIPHLQSLQINSQSSSSSVYSGPPDTHQCKAPHEHLGLVFLLIIAYMTTASFYLNSVSHFLTISRYMHVHQLTTSTHYSARATVINKSITHWPIRARCLRVVNSHSQLLVCSFVVGFVVSVSLLLLVAKRTLKALMSLAITRPTPQSRLRPAFIFPTRFHTSTIRNKINVVHHHHHYDSKTEDGHVQQQSFVYAFLEKERYLQIESPDLWCWHNIPPMTYLFLLQFEQK